MPTINPQAKKLIDVYIKKQPVFAQPILIKLRQIIHRADPDIVEDWKWGPNFNHDGMVCNIGAFKEWVAIVFMNGAALKDSKKLFKEDDVANQRTRKIKFVTVADVQKIEKDLAAYVQQAVRNNLAGVKATAPQRRAAQPMPADVKKFLQQRGLAKQYKTRPPYQQRDYVSWITAAKQDQTRTNRLEQMLEELEDGDLYMGTKYKGGK